MPLDINWEANKNSVGTPETHIGAQGQVIHTDIQSCQRISTAPNRSSDHEMRSDASVAHGGENNDASLKMLIVSQGVQIHPLS